MRISPFWFTLIWLKISTHTETLSFNSLSCRLWYFRRFSSVNQINPLLFVLQIYNCGWEANDANHHLPSTCRAWYDARFQGLRLWLFCGLPSPKKLVVISKKSASLTYIAALQLSTLPLRENRDRAFSSPVSIVHWGYSPPPPSCDYICLIEIYSILFCFQMKMLELTLGGTPNGVLSRNGRSDTPRKQTCHPRYLYSHGFDASDLFRQFQHHGPSTPWAYQVPPSECWCIRRLESIASVKITYSR